MSGRFKPGQAKPAGSGRKKNVRNAVTKEIRQLARELLDQDYFDVLYWRLRDGKCAPQIETLMHHFAFGRPKTLVEISGAGDGKIPLDVMRSIVEIAEGNEKPKPKKPRPKKPPKPKAPAHAWNPAPKTKKLVKQSH